MNLNGEFQKSLEKNQVEYVCPFCGFQDYSAFHSTIFLDERYRNRIEIPVMIVECGKCSHIDTFRIKNQTSFAGHLRLE